MTEVEGAGAAAAPWPEPEWARCADTDDRHDRVGHGVPVAVTVPGHRVLAVAVAVEPDRVEKLVVAPTHGVAHRGEDRQRFRTAALGAPPRREPWLGQATLVHGHRPLAPRQLVQQLVEDDVVAVQPVGGMVEPGLAIELDPLQAGEPVVDRRLVDAEQRSLQQ